MAVYKEDIEDAKGQLWNQEIPLVTARQRNLGPGMSPINPTVIIATDKRVIIINKTTLGMRKDIESIPYDRIASVRLENGFISASVYLRVGGYTSPGGGEQGFLKKGEQEGEIPGLKKNDAKDLSDFLSKVVAGVPPMQAASQPQPVKDQMMQSMPSAPQQPSRPPQSPQNQKK